MHQLFNIISYAMCAFSIKIEFVHALFGIFQEAPNSFWRCSFLPTGRFSSLTQSQCLRANALVTSCIAFLQTSTISGCFKTTVKDTLSVCTVFVLWKSLPYFELFNCC